MTRSETPTSTAGGEQPTARGLSFILARMRERAIPWLRSFALSMGIDVQRGNTVVVGPPPLDADQRPASQSMPDLAPAARWEFGGIALTTVGILSTAMLVQILVLSPIFFVRQQQILFDNFRFELANATAPVGQVDQNDLLLEPGRPVALMEIEDIGVDVVVVEGTDSATLMSGVGHRRDTPLPGQAGTVVVYGRQFTFGGPFSRISELEPGAKITVVTGQGRSTYAVDNVRYTGDPMPQSDGTVNRLTLVSAAGIPLVPTSVVRVDATLIGQANVTPAQMFAPESLRDSEAPLAGDGAGWTQLALILVFATILVIVLGLSLRFWGPRQTWVVATPLMLALGIALGTQVSIILPNLL